jgi:hypothetical protein
MIGVMSEVAAVEARILGAIEITPNYDPDPPGRSRVSRSR